MNRTTRQTHSGFRNWRAACGTLALCALASGGCAQHRVATSFEGLKAVVKPGRTVYVTSTSGQELEGKLERVLGTVADLNVSGRTIPVLERDTARIAVPEPLWQGVVVGALSGAGLAGLAQMLGEVAEMCGLGAALSGRPPPDCPSKVPRAMLIGAGLGGLIGAGLDALLWKRTTIFAPPQPGTGASLELSPTAGRRDIGLRVIVRF